MKLSKSDALFLYGVLFHQSSTKNTGMGYQDEDRLSDLLNSLSDYVLAESADVDAEVDADLDDEDDDDTEESSDDEDVPEAEDIVRANVLASLPAIAVVSPTGSKVDLEFEDIGDENSVDALLDEGSTIIDSVTHVKLNKDSVELYDSTEWHKFAFKKSPKSWLKQLSVGIVYGVGWHKRSNEEDE